MQVQLPRKPFEKVRLSGAIERGRLGNGFPHIRVLREGKLLDWIMDSRIKDALNLLGEAGACFPDSFAALDGAKVIADGLDRARKEALREAEETSLVPDASGREPAHH